MRQSKAVELEMKWAAFLDWDYQMASADNWTSEGWRGMSGNVWCYE